MTATRFTPTRRVRFKLDGGWRSGEVVATSLDQLRMELAWYPAAAATLTLRVRDPLTGFYYDVPAAECEDITNERRTD